MIRHRPELLSNVQHDPEAREDLARVNQVDPLDEEQTWPSEQELLDVKKLNQGRVRRRNLPAGVFVCAGGTSEGYKGRLAV